MAAAKLGDSRDPGRIRHSLRAILAQRVNGLCCGHEDLNDHAPLREDLAMQTAVGGDESLASSPTLSRLETRATRVRAWALHEVLIEQFIASRERALTGLMLDVDASDVPLHGQQELREFHGYYDQHCYLPLYVFCGEAIPARYLRQSRIDGAKNVTALLKLLIGRLRRAWPKVQSIVRGDSGFCRQRLMRWCERHQVGYVLGLAHNARLEHQVSMVEQSLAEQYAASGVKQREIGEFTYAARISANTRAFASRMAEGSSASGGNRRRPPGEPR